VIRERGIARVGGLDDADFRSGRVEIEHLPKDISQKVGAGAAPCHPWVGRRCQRRRDRKFSMANARTTASMRFFEMPLSVIEDSPRE
jgi:hypothetical protein